MYKLLITKCCWWLYELVSVLNFYSRKITKSFFIYETKLSSNCLINCDFALDVKFIVQPDWPLLNIKCPIMTICLLAGFLPEQVGLWLRDTGQRGLDRTENRSRAQQWIVEAVKQKEVLWSYGNKSAAFLMCPWVKKKERNSSVTAAISHFQCISNISSVIL